MEPIPARAPRLRANRCPGETYRQIYAVVARIPRGRVATYGQVAALAGWAHAPRLAGYALHALPEHSPLPWHRVVAAGGRLSLARLSPDGATTQRIRLEHEGVRFDGRGRVDLARHGYRPRANAAPRGRRSTHTAKAPAPRRRAGSAGKRAPAP
jgi:methylated-DNA-protein-cysteine methyltransferase-like protein